MYGYSNMEFPNVWYEMNITGPPRSEGGSSRDVLVYTKEGSMFITQYDHNDEQWIVPWYRPDVDHSEITHWRFLPTEPSS